MLEEWVRLYMKKENLIEEIEIELELLEKVVFEIRLIKQ